MRSPTRLKFCSIFLRWHKLRWSENAKSTFRCVGVAVVYGEAFVQFMVSSSFCSYRLHCRFEENFMGAEEAVINHDFCWQILFLGYKKCKDPSVTH